MCFSASASFTAAVGLALASLASFKKVKNNYNPQRVYDTFLKYHPHFYYGVLAELEKFVNMVEDGLITGKSHLNNYTLDQFIAAGEKYRKSQKQPQSSQVEKAVIVV